MMGLKDYLKVTSKKASARKSLLEKTTKRQRTSKNGDSKIIPPVPLPAPSLFVKQQTKEECIKSANDIESLQQKATVSSVQGTKRIRPRESLEEYNVHDPKENIKSTFSKITPVTLPTVAAHKRYANLVKEKPKAKPLSEPQVQLPSDFLKLESMFLALETVITFNQARGQSSIFHKIKKAVENICRRAFEIHHLAQIFTIFPKAYEISPTVIYNEKGNRIESIFLGFPYVNHFSGPQLARFHYDALKLDRDLKIRKKLFKEKLIEIVDKAHKEFLNKNKLEFNEKGWHPDFNLEADVAAIEECDHVCFAKKKEVVIAKPVVVAENPAVAAVKDTPIPASQPPLSRAEALLQRIKEKERLKKEQMEQKRLKTPAQQHELLLISRTPEIIRSMHFFFIQEKRKGLLMTELIPHLVGCHKVAISSRDMTFCVRKICEVNPEFCKIITLNSGEECVRWNREADLKLVIKKMEELKKTL